MTTQDEKGAVEVTQADRDAAADYLETMHVAVRWDQGSIDGVRGGQGDGLSLVQAFASHRLATLPPQHGDARELPKRLHELRTALNTGAGLKDPAKVYVHQTTLDQLEAALSRQDRPEGVGELQRRVEKWLDILIPQDRDARAIRDDARNALDALAEALASRPAPDGWVLDEALRRLLEKIARPCALGCTAIECPQPGEPPRADDSDCCIARRALAASPSALSGEAGDE